MNNSLTVEDLDRILQRVRTGAQKYVTNFFVSRPQFVTWIKRGLRVVAECEHFVVLSRAEEKCIRLFFAGNRCDMNPTLSEAGQVMSSLPLVVDIIGQPSATRDLTDELSAIDFRAYLRLVRLSRIGVFEFKEAAPGQFLCETAKPEDVQFIIGLLHQDFDAYTDQFPGQDEIHNAMEAGSILVSRCKSRFGGFLWYEKTGLTSLIRYWGVSADARGLGVGSGLMRDYFGCTGDCTRHMLWVRENNSTAISCYHHYGYKADGIEDQILLLER